MAGQDLSGHVALVTGGSRGIGAAIAMTLAEAGAAVAVNYRERADDAEAVVAQIKASGGRAIAVAADVSQSAAVTEMVEQVARDARPDRHSRQQCRHRDRARRRRTHRRRFRPDHPGQPEIGVPLHPGGIAGDAGAQMGPHRQHLLGCRARRRRHRPALQCLQGRHGGPDTRLCGAPGQGGHHRQQRGAVADRDRHDEAAAPILPATFRSAAWGSRRKSRRRSRWCSATTT